MVLLRSCWLPPCHWCLSLAELQVRLVPLTCLCPAAADSCSTHTVARCLGQKLVPILCILPKRSWGDGTCCSGACTDLALGPQQGLETCHLSDAPLCSCPYVWYPSQAVHHTSISCVPGVPPSALLVPCTSRANLNTVFLDSRLTQLVRIFKYFDLFFLKYQLSEAHIGLMKQVQFLN